MVADQVNISNVCQLPEPKDVLIPEPRTVPDLKLLCEKIKGKVTVIKTYERQKDLIGKFIEFFPVRTCIIAHA
jgi:hypothetical protein